MKFRYKDLFLSGNRSWAELEGKIELLETTKERGDAFEEFVFLFFTLNTTYYQIDSVYMHPIPIEIKDRLGISRYDAGVDGVIERIDGTLVAYQAKFRTGRKKPGYGEIAKLWAEARNATMTYIVANCDSITDLADQQSNNHNVLVDRFDALTPDFFIELEAYLNESALEHTYFSPDPHQEKIIEDVITGFSDNDRGKVISACGTGKTLTSLWIAERLEVRTVLFVAPSLALIKQTLAEWSNQTRRPFRYLCVCSDRTVADDVESRFSDDFGDIGLEDVDFGVSTSVPEIASFLEKELESTPLTIIFSTYHSLNLVGEATKECRSLSFDVAIFDEAHRTAGLKVSNMFSYGLFNENISIKKRLFMTATEKLVLPRTIERIQNRADDVELFSMCDQDKYGTVFSRLNFGEAIKKGVISDYEIVLAAAKSSELFELIGSNPKFISEDITPHNLFTRAQSIFKQVLIAKCFSELGVNKTISFHSTVNQAKAFVFGSGAGDYELKSFFSELCEGYDDASFYFDHVNGTMSASHRKQILDRFERTPRSIVSNAQCLTEGVNLPEVDCIYFVDSKHSMIDIIQACGRALRKKRDGNSQKIAYFVVPVLIDDSVSEDEFVNASDFSTLHNIIQALRDEDNRLAEWIDEANLNHVRGKSISCSSFGGKRSGTDKIKILGYGLNLDYFASKIALRIATINSRSELKKYEKNKLYGKDDRKASIKRVFRTIADYGVEKYNDSLVEPTLERLRAIGVSEGSQLTTAQIKVNNNNISHCLRLGMFSAVPGKRGQYLITKIGVGLVEKRLSFLDVYKRQILLYSIIGQHGVLFPYAACLYILHERERLTFLEFVYALYSLQGSSKSELVRSLEIIDYIREKYPLIESLSQSNKQNVIQDLNEKFDLNYKVTDIWDKKQTTINNQFIYFKNNLSIYGNLLKFESMQIHLIRNDKRKLADLLRQNTFFNQVEVDIPRMQRQYLNL